MTNDINIFVPFKKSDNDQHIVEGVASSEELDSQGEVVKYNAIKKALPNYLGELDQTTGKHKFGSIREMHQWSAVGKTVGTYLDDMAKQLIITAKIIDKTAWEKVKEGVYSGFSIGGKVIKRIGNNIEALTLNEISLVDRPANPEAVFSMVKSASGDFAKDYLSKGAWDTRILASMICALEDMLGEEQQENDTQTIKAINSAITALKLVAAHEIMEPTDESMDEGYDSPMAVTMTDAIKDLSKDSNDARQLVSMIQSLEMLLQRETAEGDKEAIKGINNAITALKTAAVTELNETEESNSKQVEQAQQAEAILTLAVDIRKMFSLLESQGKSTLAMNKALIGLKTVAGQILNKEQKEKFDHILYRMDFAELEKNNLSQVQKVEEKTEKPDIKKFVDHNWSSGYFDNLKKVI